MDLGVGVMKEYSIFAKSPKLKPHHQLKFSVRTRWPLCRGIQSAYWKLRWLNSHLLKRIEIMLLMINIPVNIKIQFCMYVRMYACMYITETAIHEIFRKMVKNLTFQSNLQLNTAGISSLVSCSNVISTFLGYFIPKSFLETNSSGAIFPIASE